MADILMVGLAILIFVVGYWAGYHMGQADIQIKAMMTLIESIPSSDQSDG